MGRSRPQHRAGQAGRGGVTDSPFRWFWAGTVKAPCPDCGNKTSTGFDRHDPGTREPSKCAGCAADVISNAAQFTRESIPLAERGPCASCGEACRKYGPQGSPSCGTCSPRLAEVQVPDTERAYTPMPRSELPWLQPQVCSGTADCAEKDTQFYAGGWRCETHPPVWDMAGAFISIKGDPLPVTEPAREDAETARKAPSARVPAPGSPAALAESGLELSLF